MFRSTLAFLFFLAGAGFGHAADCPTVPGKLAVLKKGIAYAPASAPQEVKNAIWAVNTIRKMPYRWGGGHGTFTDRGYDCSGTVSFLLHAAGLLERPTPSKALQCWGEAGRGKWITVYARSGHVFAVVCGLRLDTTGHRDDEGPRWRDWTRDPRGFVARHPADL
ncbi:MAG: hypothetical protein QOE70_4437 [Chthoniobacter sp.]|jgi:hypothetical protein|nr:hypothetical protein [Chthoniobacter sp.]